MTKIQEAIEILQSAMKDFALLKKTNTNPPAYEKPTSPEDLFETLKKISTVFTGVGTLNGKSSYAETYALCLIQDKKPAKALELFNLIAEDEKDLLLIHNPLANGVYHSEETADQHRKLGFEGLYQYAKLLIEKNPQRAKKLLLEIAEKIPTICYPIHLQDVRVNAILALMDLGVSAINKIPIKEELKKAKTHQY